MEYFPGLHNEQLVRELSASDPGGQDEQVELPEEFEYFPIGQDSQNINRAPS
jgi:hypothetical protein